MIVMLAASVPNKSALIKILEDAINELKHGDDIIKFSMNAYIPSAGFYDIGRVSDETPDLVFINVYETLPDISLKHLDKDSPELQ